MSDPAEQAEAIRAAVAARYSPAAAEKWERIARDRLIDWSGMVDQALAAELGPLLYDAVRTSQVTGLADEAQSRLRDIYYQTATQNTLSLHELSTILKSLSDSGVPVVLLKGAALLPAVYKNIALRPMGDVDILLPFRGLDNALRELTKLGFEIQERRPVRDLSGLFWSQLVLVNSGFDRPELELHLELHWHLLDNPYYAPKLVTEELLGRSQPVSIIDQESRVLAVEDQLLHLCCHNLYHHLGGIYRTNVDLAYTIWRFKDEINWDNLLRSAIRQKVVLAVQRSMIQAAESWYAEVPGPVLAELRKLRPSRLEGFFVSSQQSEFMKVLRTLVTLPGIGLKGRFARGQLFPDRAYLSWRYGLADSTPLPVGYAKRYASGLANLAGEISGRRPSSSLK